MDRHNRGDRFGDGGKYSRMPSRWPSDTPPNQHQRFPRGGGIAGGGEGFAGGRYHPYRGPPDYSSAGGQDFRDAHGDLGGHQMPMGGQKRGFAGRGGGSPDYGDGNKFAKLFVGSVPKTATEEDGVASNMKKVHRRFDKFFEKLLNEHRLKPKDFKSADDFLSALIEMKSDMEAEHDKLTDTNIKGLLQDMFIAGTEPTSIIVEWALAELIRNPDLLTRAQHELDSIVGRNRLVSELDLPNLPLLQAIIKETFRLHPAAPLSVPRIAIEDCEVDGYLIPKGATLLVNIWAIGRDPVSWPNNPLMFQPDRFLPSGQHANVDSKGNDFELITFGAGRRICAGMSLALRFVHFMTAMLVHAFDWILADDLISNKLDMEEAYGATLRKKNPLVAHPVPRLAAQAYI